ncbi:hypothetical protein B7463_g8620, partial [Scytalidium lignicola]
MASSSLQSNLHKDCYRDAQTGHIVFGRGLFAPEVHFPTSKRAQSQFGNARLPTPPMSEEEKEDESQDYRHPVPAPNKSGWVIDDISGRQRKRLMMDDLAPAMRQRWIERQLDLQQQEEQEVGEDIEMGEIKRVRWDEESLAAQRREPRPEKAGQLRAMVRAWERNEAATLLRRWWDDGEDADDEREEEDDNDNDDESGEESGNDSDNDTLSAYRRENESWRFWIE